MRDDNPKVLVNRNESAVEGAVVERRQRDSVAWVHAVLVERPGNDVAGRQELWDADSRDGAGEVVAGHAWFAEEGLEAANLCRTRGLRWTLSSGSRSGVGLGEMFRQAEARETAALLSAASCSQSFWNSSKIIRSAAATLLRPLMPRAWCWGSSEAKLQSFIETELGVRSRAFANLMMSGLLRSSLPKGVRQ